MSRERPYQVDIWRDDDGIVARYRITAHNSEDAMVEGRTLAMRDASIKRPFTIQVSRSFRVADEIRQCTTEIKP